jgi:hypothetical protein
MNKLYFYFVIIILIILFVILYKCKTKPFKKCPSKMKPLEDNWCMIANESSSLPTHMLESDTNYRVPGEWLNDESLQRMRTELDEKSGWVYGWQMGEEGPNREWMNWGLIFNGEPCKKNADLCPDTMNILSSIPGIQVAGFSLMMPRSIIKPHTDETGASHGSMAYHLGLNCPPKCNMMIGDNKMCEQNGKSFIFDATATHWAENKSDDPRMILYIDYKI